MHFTTKAFGELYYAADNNWSLLLNFIQLDVITKFILLAIILCMMKKEDHLLPHLLKLKNLICPAQLTNMGPVSVLTFMGPALWIISG